MRTWQTHLKSWFWIGVLLGLAGCSFDLRVTSLLRSEAVPRLKVQSVEVQEGDAASFTFVLENPNGEPISFAWSTRSIEATAGIDFVSQSGSVTITSGTTAVTVTVPTIDDALYEDDERFEIEITQIENAKLVTDRSSMSVEALIIDNDPKPSLSIADVSVVEGLDAQLTVTLSAVSGLPTRVSFATVAGTATTADFTASSGTVTIPAGSLTAQIAIPTFDDAISEANETFQVVLSSPFNATIASPNATVTILDNDTLPTVGFLAATSSFSESVGAASVTVGVTGATSSAVTVPYTVTGTAGAGDHDLVDGTLTIPAGQASGTIAFNVTNDLLDEDDETIIITLGSPSGADPGTILVHTVTLVDDDLPPSLSIADVTVGEAAGTATFTVSLSAASGRDVTFDWATTAGTATAGSDYTTSGVAGVTIPAGSTSTTVSIPILQDSVRCEGDETFTVVLSNAVLATISDDTALGTITDDDIVSLSINDAAVVEGVTADFVVSLDQTCPRDVTFNWSTANGTAVAGTNYSSSGASGITIPAGSLSVPLEVPTLAAGISNSLNFTVNLASVSTHVNVADNSGLGVLSVPPLNLVMTSALSPAVTLTRASVGTYFGSDGLLKTAAVDAPRFDHDPLTGTPLGLLIEGYSTNLIPDSEDFLGASWWSDGILNVTANVTTAPTGAAIADLLEDADPSEGARRAYDMSGVGDNEVWTFSVFIKKGTSRYVNLDLEFLGGAVPVQPSIPFDLDTGAWTPCGAGIVTASAKDVGNGWYRLAVTIMNNASGNTDLMASIYPAQHPGVTCAEDDGLIGTVYAWGAQLERSGFPSSYIPNFGNMAGVERKADIVKTTNTSWYNVAGGTFVVNADLNFDDTTQQSVFFSTGGANDNIGLFKMNWQDLAFYILGAGVTSLDEWNGEAWGAGNKKRIAIAGRQDDFAFASEGTVKKTSASGAWPTAPTEFQIGQEQGDHFLNGHVSSLQFHSYRLTDRTLETITTP